MDISIPAGHQSPARTILYTEFAIGDRVCIDQSDIIGNITGFCWKADDGFAVQVAWLFNGVNQSAWLDTFRIIKIV